MHRHLTLSARPSGRVGDDIAQAAVACGDQVLCVSACVGAAFRKEPVVPTGRLPR